MAASLSVSGVSSLAVCGEFALHVLANREQFAGQRADGGFRQGFSRHDVMRESDGVDLVVRPHRFRAERTRGNLAGFVDRIFLRDGVGGIEGEERRFLAVARGCGDGVRGDLAVERADREEGVELFILHCVGKAGSGELHDLNAFGLHAGCGEDHVQQIDVGLGAADHADALAGELFDLGDRAFLLAGADGPQHGEVLADAGNRHRILRQFGVAADHGEIGGAGVEARSTRAGAFGHDRGAAAHICGSRESVCAMDWITLTSSLYGGPTAIRRCTGRFR